MFRTHWVALGLLAVFAAGAGATEVPIARYDRVEVAPTKTSIYIGRVSMTMPPFVRQNGCFRASYSARVVPFLFFSEEGQLSIEVSDDALRALARAERIEFHGEAFNTAGERRRIEGHATPTDAHSGKLKVRVFVSKQVQLIFNTTYRFPELIAHSPAQ